MDLPRYATATQRSRTETLLIASISAAVCGCGGSGVVPIEAQFLVDGEPLQQASVSFVRQDAEGGRAAFGVTRDDGKATLTTYKPNDGVLPGEYRVTVIKAPANPRTYVEVPADEAQSAEQLLSASSGRDARAAPRRKRVRSVLPEVYTDPGSTPLSCTVTRGDREFTFEVSRSLD